jgi:hypothetical protein
MTVTVPSLSNSLTELAFRIRAENEASGLAMRRGLYHAMAAGELLIEAKGQLKHGQWLPWLKEYCATPDRSARLYMRLAENRHQIGNVANLTIQGAIRHLREADDLHETFSRLRDESCRRIELGEKLLEEFSKTSSKEPAEKATDNFARLFELVWLLGETCIKLGEHKRLGLIEDEWWQETYSQLGEGDVAGWMREGFEAYRREPLDYDQMVDAA